MMSRGHICHNCGVHGMSIFCEFRSVPVHSVLLMPTWEVAMNYPRGDIVLGFCKTCGFISNVAFNPDMQEYSSRYEETQGFSPTFNTFHQNLASRLINRYNLHGKDIIEIGCGKGEFLTILCETGKNRGVGFDPSYISDRNRSEAKDRITFIKDFYSEKYANYQGDFVCCKMTLEHIQKTSDFLSTVRRSIGNRPNTIVFFQVPSVTRILRELAFWDIYYEHCSYFSIGSLARLFRKCGLDIIDLTKDYDDQYLMIEARPGDGKSGFLLKQENDLEELTQDVVYFSKNYQNKLDAWKRNLQEITQNGRRAIIWGSGSKGVAFLTTLNIQNEIEFVVDINPYKHGMYMAGTGQKIVSPDFLQKYKPNVVIVMNPIYLEEVRQELNRMGLTIELITV
ncbi:MAG: C-methyltransferase [Candidatus Gottesmanbacteria bacterium GW2011_GWC2_39_8]|uniref:C-methyltransferase n=2 Tax=Bacteria candidate phyla TaxID=1783234 RepID=A0A0G0SDP1_9BACT|nr:MAG: C-methyltransferase [Candidatus Gottesmanbacteria bacterium GW2011_GWC2_39_8]